MKHIKVFIVDDELNARLTLLDLFRQHFPEVIVVGHAMDVETAFVQIQASKPDLVLLDIDLGKETGFHLLERLEHISFHVAFVTAFNKFALRAIKFMAIDYLLKPVLQSDVSTLLKKLETIKYRSDYEKRIQLASQNIHLADKRLHKIAIPFAAGYEVVSVNTISHLKASGSYTSFYLKEASEPIVSSYNLRFYQKELEDYGFYRIHHSLLIDTHFVRKIINKTKAYVIMENGTELSISKSRKHEFLKFMELK